MGLVIKKCAAVLRHGSLLFPATLVLNCASFCSLQKDTGVSLCVTLYIKGTGMSELKENVLKLLEKVDLPDGGNLISRDFVRALQCDNGQVRFVIEAPSAEVARLMEPMKAQLESKIADISGVTVVNIALTAHAQPAAPSLKFGGHAKPQSGNLKPSGIKTILAIGSGKGGVGKSTLTANLAVALSRAGKKVGLLDADIYGPSQPRMFALSEKPDSPDGKNIQPLKAHGVTVMSVGSMVDEEKAIIWRGPMLMGALQQMMTQVLWGELDVLLIDLPPGTGDVQLTLGQKGGLSGAIVVSTPQDVALIDARKALDAFQTLKVPVLGLVENMSQFVCPNCGEVSEIFGRGGVESEAKKLGLPLLAQLPIDLETRLAGDAGAPVALGDGVMSDAFAQLADRLIQGGIV